MRDLERLLASQGGRCGICGEPLAIDEANRDHIVPRCFGGCGELWNKRATHVDCNSRRGGAPENSAIYREALARHRVMGAHLPGAYYHRPEADP